MNQFTSEELYVLAALLGREFIIGVEGRTLENNRSDINGLYRKNYDALEARGVFEYKIDGTLTVDHEIRKMIKVLNKADLVFVIATDIRGNREKVNYLRYGNAFCRLTDKGSSYIVEETGEFDRSGLLDGYNIKITGDPVQSISIQLNTLKQLSELYNSFNETEADRYLSEISRDPETQELIRECILKKNNSFVMKEYKRSGNHMVNNRNLILRFIDDYILSFSVIDGNSLVVNVYQRGV